MGLHPTERDVGEVGDDGESVCRAGLIGQLGQRREEEKGRRAVHETAESGRDGRTFGLCAGLRRTRYVSMDLSRGIWKEPLGLPEKGMLGE